MRRKKFLACVLALCLTLALLPSAALAADTLPITWLPDGMEPKLYLEKTNQFLAKQGSNWYWLDTNGNIVTELGETGYDDVPVAAAVYPQAPGFENGLARVSKGEYPEMKFGYIDETGKVAIPLVYGDAYDFSGGLARVRLGACEGFINTSGQTVVAPSYDFVYGFSEGLSVVVKDGKRGYIDTTGKLVIPMAYDSAGAFHNGAAIVSLGVFPDGKYGLISKTGQLVTDMNYDTMMDADFDGELITVVRNDRTGAINAAGQQVFPCQYRLSDLDGIRGLGVASGGFLMEFTEDYKSLYYIDKSGRKLGPYDYGMGFHNGRAYVEKDGRSCVIDTDGNILFYLDAPAGLELNYYDPSSGENLSVVGFSTFDNSILGAVDRTGKLVLPYEYGQIMVFGPAGYVWKDGKYGLFTVPGQQPATSETPSNLPTVENIPATGTAVARTQNVLLDGKTVQFQYYAVKNAQGNETNYVKIRDLAQALNGTKAQFNVGWDGKISITSNTAYQAVGGEGTTPYSGDQPYKSMSGTPVSFNGGSVNLTSFSITYQGGGYTYYKLRDLGQLLGFNVTWNGGVVIESDKPYTGK